MSTRQRKKEGYGGAQKGKKVASRFYSSKRGEKKIPEAPRSMGMEGGEKEGRRNVEGRAPSGGREGKIVEITKKNNGSKKGDHRKRKPKDITRRKSFTKGEGKGCRDKGGGDVRRENQE